MVNNSKWLNRFVSKLSLEQFQESFDKALEILNSEQYKIVVDDNIEGKPIRSFQHFRSCDSSIKRLYLNPSIKNYLDGDDKNFIWGLLHEIGHILTVGIRKNDQEMREVIAWDQASHMLINRFPELLDYRKQFESRAISSLKSYWTNPQNKWRNTYEWVTDECGDRTLNRVPNKE